jgi:hypothetical protein
MDDLAEVPKTKTAPPAGGERRGLESDQLMTRVMRSTCNRLRMRLMMRAR